MLTRSQAEPLPTHWRSLHELGLDGAADAYLNRVEHSLPAALDEPTRRRFLAALGASLALATAQGCRRQPPEAIVPYVEQPENIVPGRPLFYATAMPFAGAAKGLLVESHMGRPTKIEGNPRHPDITAVPWRGETQNAPGTSDIFCQAALLELYDPDRSQTLKRRGDISSWDSFVSTLTPLLSAQRETRGRGLRLLSESINSPSLLAEIERLLQAFPEARWTQFEPVGPDNARSGARQAFGRPVDPHYHLEDAGVVLAIDADFLNAGPEHLRHARTWADRRDPASGRNIPRLYAAELTPTLTGSKADHRLPLGVGEVGPFVELLASLVGVSVEDSNARQNLPKPVQSWLEVVADDLQSNGNAASSRGLVIPGGYLEPRLHALVHAINSRLGQVGTGITYTEPADNGAAEYESLATLCDELRAKQVELLVVLGGNPAYASPADLGFAAALEQARLAIHFGLYEDETAALCDWHVPAAHFLESWGDVRASDGTVTILQPLIAPLYQGRTAAELVAVLAGSVGQSAQNIVKDHWRSTIGRSNDFETRWQTALHDGVFSDTALPATTPQLQSAQPETSASADAVRPVEPSAESSATDHLTIDLVFRPDPCVYDGRFANNGWLQELPKPFTKLTWGSAALVSPHLGAQLGIRSGDLVEITAGERQLTVPVWLLPGQPQSTVTLHLGGGRSRAGRVGTKIGFNAFELQSSKSPWQFTGASVRRINGRGKLTTTQNHHSVDGRDIVRVYQIADLESSAPRDDQKPEHPSFFPAFEYTGHKWAMTIDLERCIGCNACTIACQAENNIPVVGQDQVDMGREMHWIRVDTYFEGPPENPRSVHQPLPCMHCETAPCEVVCPVAATVHDEHGLNEMVYNRCVGTRYCSNNCPYKVRRFNFLQYSDLETSSLKLMRNPQVTVRNRGVMEKCTYCIQRINAGRIAAKLADRELSDGQVVTACQAACPTQAITFGDLNDAQSRVAALTADRRNYALLEELNTRPRTTYLAAVRNPNSRLAAEA